MNARSLALPILSALLLALLLSACGNKSSLYLPARAPLPEEAVPGTPDVEIAPVEANTPVATPADAAETLPAPPPALEAPPEDAPATDDGNG